jgi:hypothetical protein
MLEWKYKFQTTATNMGFSANVTRLFVAVGVLPYALRHRLVSDKRQISSNKNKNTITNYLNNALICQKHFLVIIKISR